ncbi:MAG: hypothetical protein A4E65_02527 [Syntrophorhabdus sp. PtaU1.Bin153]|nr:MAG: hypothetical protein A4E65_02527 [Syntrophorhabdus sp. PtaU1.Bin153]
MAKVKLLLALFLGLFVMADVGYAGGSGGSRYHGAGRGGRDRGLSTQSDRTSGFGGQGQYEAGVYTGSKGYRDSDSSGPSGKPAEYGQKTHEGDKGGSPAGDLSGYDVVEQSEACLKFLDETEKLRKTFDDKRAAHFKSRNDPATSPEDIADHQAEIRELWRTIEGRNTDNCRWVH